MRDRKRPLFRPLALASPAGRACGGCTACCAPFEIAELNKPAGVPCPHLAPSGCGIYAARPAPCRAFECLWLRDLLPAAMKPDVVGYIVSTNWSGDFLQVNELIPGATDGCRHFAGWAEDVRRRGIEVRVVPSG